MIFSIRLSLLKAPNAAGGSILANLLVSTAD